MTKGAAAFRPDDQIERPFDSFPANDNGAGLPPLRIRANKRCLPGPAANDDWIEEDLPISIGVIAEEVVILDGFLRSQILALFD